MHYSQDFINAKLQAIRECQQREYIPAPKVISGRKVKAKVKLTDDEKSAAKIAKGIIKARKEKKQREDGQEKVFKTKTRDLSQLIPLRIDYKTIVYIKPGDDPEAVKLKYKNRFNKTPDDTMKEKLGYNYQF